jgi:hypothetical protein
MAPTRRFLPCSGCDQVALKPLDRQLLITNRHRDETERLDTRDDLRSSLALDEIRADPIAVAI